MPHKGIIALNINNLYSDYTCVYISKGEIVLNTCSQIHQQREYGLKEEKEKKEEKAAWLHVHIRVCVCYYIHHLFTELLKKLIALRQKEVHDYMCMCMYSGTSS